MVYLLIFSVFGFALFLFLLIKDAYVACPTGKAMVVYKMGSKKGPDIITGGSTFIWPLVNTYEIVDLKPRNYDFHLLHLNTQDGATLEMHLTMNIGLGTDDFLLENGIARFEKLSVSERRNILRGEVKNAVSDYFLQQKLVELEDFFTSDKKDQLFDSIKKGIGQYGQKAFHINVTDLEDNLGYLRKAQQKITADLKASIRNKLD